MTARSPGPTAADIAWLASVAFNIVGITFIAALAHRLKAASAVAVGIAFIETAGWAGWL